MEYKNELLRDAIEGYQKEYQELFEVWKNLEGKAQGIITVSGIFLAAMFAFIRNLSGPVKYYEQCLLTISVILLVLSVVSALCAQRLRDVYQAPYGKQLGKVVEDLLNLNEISSDIFSRYLVEQNNSWKEVNSNTRYANKKKANSLLVSQLLLVLSILCFVVYTSIKIWSI
jgi:hypothetical protein